MTQAHARTAPRARPIGINHVAIEVGDVDAAVAFYQRLLDVELRGRTESMAFLDMGDQFLALSEGRTQAVDDHRHLGLVVDDPEHVRSRARELDATLLDTRGLDLLDPWGNRIQIVAYADVQFLKDERVLDAMDAADVAKSPSALEELRKKGVSV